MVRRELCDEISMNLPPCGDNHDQTGVRNTSYAPEGAFDISSDAKINRAKLDTEGLRRRLNNRPLADAGWCTGVSHDTYAFDPRCDLAEQLKPFSTQAVLELEEASGVAVWPRQRFDGS